MDDPFPLDEPQPETNDPGRWRLVVREHMAKEFATPSGGLRFASLGDAQAHVRMRAQWIGGGFSVWATDDLTGECHVRQPDGSWHCTREANTRSWWKGKRNYGLGSARVGRAR